MTTNKLKLTPIKLALFAMTIATPTQAAVIEEVIVTAQKRAESSQDIPVAVTAIGSKQIEALGIKDITDMSKVSPSLTITEGSNKQNTSIRIRGIGTDVFSVGIEPSVAIVIDGVSQVQPGQALANLVDVERIEVLRGPQSTLFGKNASAGLLSVVTKAPSEEFEGFVSVTGTDDGETKVSGSVSGTIADTVGVRLTGYYSELDGYQQNLAGGPDLNEDESNGVRAKVSWAVSDNLSLDFSAYSSENESNCCTPTYRFVDPTAAFQGQLPFGFMFAGIVPSDTNNVASLDVPPASKTEDDGYSVKANMALGEYELTYIGAYNEWSFENTQDVDGSAFNLLGAFTGGALSGGIVQGGLVTTEFTSHELRLASPTSDSFEYIAGIYYADAETARSFARGPVFGASFNTVSGTESIALFGNATLHMGDATRLSVGLRYNEEEISVSFNTLIPRSESESVVLGKVSLQHDLSDEVMAFASVTKGYKGQGYDISSSFNQAKADDPVNSESAIALELGVKGTYMDGQLQFNAVAFHTDYDDYQAQNTQVDGGVIVLNVNNVGSLKTYGLEVDGIALIGDNTTINFSAAYIKATIDDWTDAGCFSQQTAAAGCQTDIATGIKFQDLSGVDLNNSPDLKLTLGGRHDIEFDSLPFDGFVNVNYRWQDSTHFGLLNNPLTEHDAYGVLDLSVGILDGDDDRYQVTAFVNNVLDESYASNIDDGAGGLFAAPVTTHILSRGSQRYAGIRVRVNF